MSIRVGFLGAGFIADVHSSLLRSCGDSVSWAGVYDVDRSRAEAFAAKTGATVCGDEDEVLAACDAVFICTWTSEHPRLVEMAASRGLAIFCEKPLATDLAGARAMAEGVRRAGVVNQVGLVLRFSPAFCWLRQLISDPSSGRVMSVMFRDDQYIPLQGMYNSTWRGDVARAGSGALLEHSIHDLDIIEFLVGPVAGVCGLSSEFHGISGIEDAVNLSLSFANGAVGSLLSVWHDILERGSSRYVEIICENLWCAIDTDDWWGPVRWTRTGVDSGTLEGGELGDRVWSAGLAPVNPDEGFLDAVNRGRTIGPDFESALRAHVVVDAAYRSAAQGGIPVPVPVPEPGPA
ncbi:MAG TPA: Gfo/Idh/MocA family oxidoreductase [Acidimicrobiales bacterium]|nr:Gfo/Idh/MocA family oxidoreductase [Acidimicrobiales bacterium]